MSQNLVLKEKKPPETVNSQAPVSDSVVVSSPQPLKPLTLKEKKVNKTVVLKTQTTTNTNTENSGETTTPKYLFPLSQIQIFGGFSQYKEYGMKGSGAYLELVVRQKQDASKKSAWGLFGNYGQYVTKNPETDSTEFTSKVRETGGGLSYARNTNRPNWNSVVMNFGVKQIVDEGSILTYRRKQIDIMFVTSGYIDLTRNKNISFSRSNLSWYYQNQLRTEVESYNNGVRVDDNIWNKKMLFINFDQTVLQFDLNDAVYGLSMNFGFNLGYKHFSENKQDIYAAGGFTEFYYKFCKVGRLGIEVNIDPNSNPNRNTRFFTGKKQEVKLDLDLYQIGRMIL